MGLRHLVQEKYYKELDKYCFFYYTLTVGSLARVLFVGYQFTNLLS